MKFLSKVACDLLSSPVQNYCLLDRELFIALSIHVESLYSRVLLQVFLRQCLLLRILPSHRFLVDSRIQRFRDISGRFLELSGRFLELSGSCLELLI